jgi:hypothetical protein
MKLGDAVVWGRGSSSCQLGATVQVGLQEHSIDFRACTLDLVPQGLGSGESRTEEWMWGGEVLVTNRVDRLPPGAYDVRAVAGDLYRSTPRTIRVMPVASDNPLPEVFRVLGQAAGADADGRTAASSQPCTARRNLCDRPHPPLGSPLGPPAAGPALRFRSARFRSADELGQVADAELLFNPLGKFLHQVFLH